MSRFLIERIRELQHPHGVVAEGTFGMLNRAVGLVRVVGISRSWEDPVDGQTVLDERHQQFLTGLYHAGLPWAVLITGTPAKINVYLGLSGGAGASHYWAAPLAACFPGCETSSGPSHDVVVRQLSAFGLAARLTGNPAVGTNHDGQRSPLVPVLRIERVIRALTNSHWSYLASGTPVTPAELRQQAARFARDEQEIVGTYMRPGTADEHGNPLAEECLELLRAARRNVGEGEQLGMWNVHAVLFADTPHTLNAGAQALVGAFAGRTGLPQPIQVTPLARDGHFNSGTFAATLLTSREAAVLSRLPADSFPGYTLTRPVRYAPPPVREPDSRGVAIGRVAHGSPGNSHWVEVNLDDLSKHVLVAGVTGSGKTQTTQSLLGQLWCDHRVPWLVIEPSHKAEYRQLLNSPAGRDLRVFTPGDETCSPMRLNPLEVMPGVHVQTHIDGVFALFNASFALVTPMPDVLGLALHELYERFGWDLVRGTHPRGPVADVQPTLTDLLEVVRSVVRELGYDRDVTANIRAGLETRLRNLIAGGKGVSLDTPSSLPMEALLSRPAIVELRAIGDDDQKALLIAVLMLRLAEYRRVQGLREGRLQHVLVLEEAHRLLRNVPETVHSENANPRGKAVESFCNMLSEMRAYGQGALIVDQIPAKLAPDAIKSTNLKIIHRLLAEDDRRLVGGAMDLNPDQHRHLVTLRAGEAVVSGECLSEPCLVQVPNHAESVGYAGKTPDDAAVRLHMGLGPLVAPRANSRPAGAAPCMRVCVSCGGNDCGFRPRVLRDLLNHDHREVFLEAVAGGFEGLWQFGLHRARAFCRPEENIADAASCFLVQLATAAEFGSVEIEKLRHAIKRLRVIDRGGQL